MNSKKDPQTGLIHKRLAFAADAARMVSAEAPVIEKLALRGLFVAIIGSAIGLAGPYGTFTNMSIIPRIGYWLLAISLPWILWETFYALGRALLPRRLGSRVVMALLMPPFALGGSLLATGLNGAVFGREEQSFFEAWSTSLLNWLLFSICIILPLILIADELSRRERHKGGADLLGFFSLKIPEKLRDGDLIAIKSEGHYLRVFTSRGDDLILMSLEDAIAALSAYPGVRTHRSWWVAVDQIASENVSSELVTHGGLRVPVSRRRRSAVRDLLASKTS
ncbi:MAG: LytTR family DNA-binding domain-containing protein [Pseudomonadota bacterium]